MLKYAIPILLLATSGLQGQPKCQVYHERVTIQLGKGSSAMPDPACVASRGRVRWCSAEGNWAVVFPSDAQSPLPQGPTPIAGPKGGCSPWMQVRRCPDSQARCVFRYHAQVSPYPPRDAEIEVEPD